MILYIQLIFFKSDIKILEKRKHISNEVRFAVETAADEFRPCTVEMEKILSREGIQLPSFWCSWCLFIYLYIYI
jgi:hypothetical protein